MSGLKDLMYQKLLEGNQTASGMGDLTKLLLQMEVPKRINNVFTNWIKQKLQNSIDSIKNHVNLYLIYIIKCGKQ